MLGLMDTAPRCKTESCPFSNGSAVKLGSSLNAILTLPDEPRVRKFWIDVTKSSGKCLPSTNCRKVRFGSAADMTTLDWSSSPFSSVTPTARPFLTMTCFTEQLTRISTPSATAALRIEPLTPPEPFLAKPQARKEIGRASCRERGENAQSAGE